METKEKLHTILLIDDHHIVRAGIKLILTERLNVLIDEAANSASAIDQIKKNSYNLIILDINMPDTNGFQLLSQILRIKSESNVLMFSMNPEEHFAKRFIKAGAKGYLNKEASDNEILKAVSTILSGKKYISDGMTQMLLDESTHDKTDNPFKLLSNREFEVAIGLIKGKKPGEIADQINLHSSTIGTYKTRILEKLNVHNVIELNQLAIMYNIHINE